VLAAGTGFAQMYTVRDLGAFDGSWSEATGINASGEVVGNTTASQFPATRAYRTAPNQPINQATDDIGAPYCDLRTFQPPCLGPVTAYGINNSGQVVGQLEDVYASDHLAFTTGPNVSIRSPNDWFGFNDSVSTAVNGPGQVLVVEGSFQSLRLTPSAPGQDFNDYLRQNLGTLSAGGIGGGSGNTNAYGLNDLGQAVGGSDIGTGGAFSPVYHAFRTRANKAIRSVSDDLGTLGGSMSFGYAVNVFGEVVGTATTPGDASSHAFRTKPNRKINPAKDDLGTLGGSYSAATSVNGFGEAVGWSALTGDGSQHAFIVSSGGMQDLNNLVVASPGCDLVGSTRNSPDISDNGQIAANRICNGQQHAVLLTPIYKALVQLPIKADGSSVFSVQREVIPLRFRLLQEGTPTCTLPPAKVAIKKVSAQTQDLVSEVIISEGGVSSATAAGVVPILCQYVDQVQPPELGIGTYRVDLSINEIMVGHAVFTLR